MTTTTGTSPRSVIMNKIEERLNKVRDVDRPLFGTLTIKIKYRQGRPLEEISFALEETC